ncbi:hypothetical protein [Propionibacterium australiense]|uniref:hypothetical protein n=1 Tax=Propionibacterium australiense TaxID=119981 RepID=UPI0011C36235|nr:hypothetical protein [Propionibacterium australiense]
MTMGRSPVLGLETETPTVLSVLRGEITVTVAARMERACEQTIGRWAVFLEGREDCSGGRKAGPARPAGPSSEVGSRVSRSCWAKRQWS